MVRKINLILIGLIVIFAGLWFATHHTNTKTILNQETGFVYAPAKEIGEFTLVDLDGVEIDQGRFADKWWLVYFGFTYCPDACPTALSDMKKIKISLKDSSKQNIEFVFISVDPDRDTPERLKQYVQYFDPRFYGATGEPDQLEKLAKNMGVVFVVPENPVDENYLVGHSSFLLLLNQKTQLTAIFKVPHNPDEVAEGIMKIQNYFGDS